MSDLKKKLETRKEELAVQFQKLGDKRAELIRQVQAIDAEQQRMQGEHRLIEESLKTPEQPTKKIPKKK